jgi:hypothetical protein
MSKRITITVTVPDTFANFIADELHEVLRGQCYSFNLYRPQADAPGESEYDYDLTSEDVPAPTLYRNPGDIIIEI